MADEIIKIDIHIIKAIKEIFKEENLSWEISSYGGNRFIFTLPNKWIENHYSILFKHSKFISMERLDSYIKMILSCNYISKEDKIKYNLMKVDIRLMRRTCVIYNTDGYFELSSKRPFGNSNIIGDFLECYGIDYIYNNQEKYKTMLDESILKIANYLINATFDEDLEAFRKGWLCDFVPTNTYLRKIKIKKLLDN